MSEALKEALRSDGTPFVVVTDADIAAGQLLTASGAPAYPIVISLANEAISSNEVTPLLNYVSAGGYLFMGGSSFTRNPDGTTLGDFALASQMGLHMAVSNLQNWYANTTFTNSSSGNQLTSHIPTGTAMWQMPLTSEDISWGTSPHPSSQSQIQPYHYIWQVTNSHATVIATGDNGLPYVTTTPYGQGQFIYDAAMQPLLGVGGFAPGMYAYGIFRNAIQWAFQSANLPIAKVSPWPYQYNAAYMVRHDLEDYQSEISGIESSAQFDNSQGALGEYYFCTGTLRVEMADSPSVVTSLQQAATQYGAIIGSHNGGLVNPNNSSLVLSDFDYWHWGPDEALSDTVPGYSSGSAYASASMSESFSDINTWMSGYEPNVKTWVAPYFNGTREGSNQILQQLGVPTTGEQKLGPFPHWTLSTQTDGLRYPALTLPVSDWILPAGACGPDYCIACNQSNCVAQSMDYYNVASVDAAVDYYYSIGALINIYMHELSTDSIPAEYIQHSASYGATVWPVNALTLLGWWTNRAPVQITPSYAIANNRLNLTATISGATDSRTAVEFVIPNWAVNSGTLQVLLDGSPASPSSYRTFGSSVKVSVGTSVSTVQVSYAVPSSTPTVSSVTLNPTLVTPGTPSTGTVTLNEAAPTGGTVVTLTSGNTAAATVPASVTVPAGSTSATFTVTTLSVATSTDVTITAADPGSSQSAVLTVAPPVSVSSVTLSPTLVTSGTPSTGTVTLNEAAPTGGTVVTLTSGNTAAATVPASVTVPAGSTSATFTVTTLSVATLTTVTITAANSGSSQSATLTVLPAGSGGTVLFSDNFSGGNGADPSWTTESGTWAISSGVMTGTGSTNSYAYEYANNGAAWSNYSVLGQVQFQAGAYGGGIGGYVNPSTGAHYGAWVYPGTSQISLLKFSDWTTWGTTAMATASLPSVGTSLHTLLMSFNGDVIQVSVDGVQYISVTDSGFNSTPALTSGTISLDMWNSSTAYVMNVENVVVQSLSTTPAVSSVTLNPTSVTSGTSSTGTVTLNGAAPTGGTVVTLTSGNTSAATVPASVTVPAGSTSTTFTVTTLTVATSTAVTITAAASGSSQSAVLTVTPPVSVSSVTLNPTSVTSGTSSTGTVTLNGAAPTGGTVVTLTSGNTSAATVPASVTVPAGSTSTTFTVTTLTVATSTAVTITAAASGSSQSAVLTVTPPVSVSSVTLNPTSVTSGATSTGTVTLSGAAPTGGTVVTLTSGNTAVATVPASVTVPSGSTNTTFTATAGTVTVSTNVSITAAASGSSQSATLTVTPTIVTTSPFSVIDSPASTRITAGNTMTVAAKATGSGHGLVAVVCGQDNNNYVTSCSDNAPGGSNTYLPASQANSSVNLANTATGFCNVFYATSSKPGATSVSCSVKWGFPLSSSGEPAPGNPAGDAEMWFFELNQAISSLDSYGVANQELNASTTALAGAAVTTQSPDTWIISAMYLTGTAKSVATPFTIDINAASGNTTAYSSPTSAGTYQPVITADAKGESYCSSTAAFNAQPVVTALAVSSVTLSPTSVIPGTSSTGTVTLNEAAPTGGAVVTLTSGNTAAATVPANVTVPAGSTSATFTVTTLSVTTSTAVSITAAYSGSSQSATLTVAPLLVSSVTLSPKSVIPGTSSTGTVTLNEAAPSGGAVVTLTSGNTAAATVPASVTVPAGSTSTTFTVTTLSVTTSTAVSITAAYSGSSQSATLTVAPLLVSSVTLSPTSVNSGTSSTGTVTLSAAAPSGGAAVTLTSGNTAAATVPASVTVPAGSTSTTFTVTTLSVTTSTAVSITATYSGSSQSATLTVSPAGTGATSPFSVIDRASPNRIAAGNTMTVSTTATGSGHGLVAVVCGQDNNNYVTSCSDNAPGGSNTYLPASQANSSVNHAGATTGFCNVFYATSSRPGATSASCSVKWGFPLKSSGEPSPGNTAGDAEMWFFELNQTIHSVDSYGVANQELNASTTALAGAAVTTQNPDTWVISAMYLSGTAKSVATPFTIDIDPVSGNTTAYDSPTTAGTYQPTITANAKGDDYCSSTVAFK